MSKLMVFVNGIGLQERGGFVFLCTVCELMFFWQDKDITSEE